jgi:hypothetical protein
MPQPNRKNQRRQNHGWQNHHFALNDFVQYPSLEIVARYEEFDR